MDTSSPTSNTKLATAKTILSAAASVATAVMLAKSLTRDLLPYEIQDYFSIHFRKFYNHFSSQLTLFIDEVDGLAKNQIYEAVQIYLGSKNSTSSHSLRVSKHEKEDKMNVTIGSNEEVIDIFNGIKYKWVFVSRQIESQSLYNYSSTVQSEVRHFELSFPKKYKDVVFGSYLPYIEQEAKSLKQKSKAIKIFTVDHNNIIYRNWAEAWISVNLDHPATFETLAMEPEQKKTILQDLERFVKRKDYYRKVGKAWKRGYLLYGPPGTGKSSLIAAIANYLKFDVYDLELSEVRSNSELRALLVATTNRSILVVEDIDCTIELQDRLAAETGKDGDLQKREVTVTLSGFLNFIDGLWSSCGDERIIVFTTNHKDKLDPALLRPGRMDVHVHMSYCTPSAFRVLAQNYLNLEIQQYHCLFAEIEELIGATKVTPAEVAEQLMRKGEPELALSALIEFLNIKKKEINDQEENAKNIIQEA